MCLMKEQENTPEKRVNEKEKDNKFKQLQVFHIPEIQVWDELWLEAVWKPVREEVNGLSSGASSLAFHSSLFLSHGSCI